MSSTTERDTQRGQTLVIFALFLTVLIAFAAIAFDVGQALVDRRTQQNAADAAALAGARYLVDPANPNTSAPCASKGPSPAYCVLAVTKALQMAQTNHFGDGTSDGVAAADGTTVTVTIPPGPDSDFHGQAGFIEVTIRTNRPSIFGGILGISSQRVGVMATAGNRNGATLNASLLALNPTRCESANFAGNGSVSVAGNIQVNSDCNGTNPANSAFAAGGNSTVQVGGGGAINVHGSACPPNNGCNNSNVTPTPTTGAPILPDPFAAIPPPADKPVPANATLLDGTGTPPVGCPGNNGATELAPNLCKFNTANVTWVLSPGYYPGGLQVLKGTVYLRPGVYYIGGGGLTVSGNQAAIYSVPTNYNNPIAPAAALCEADPQCGVMIYNSEDHANGADFAQISLGGNNSVVQLMFVRQAPWKGIVIFQDRCEGRDPSLCRLDSSVGDVTLQGAGSTLWVTGAIYAPNGFVDVTGGGTIGSAAQIIADHLRVTGTGSLTIPFAPDKLPQTHVGGLVE